MFRWLLGLFTHEKKGTEIRHLRNALREQVQKTCEAAQKGDTEATLKLEAFKETLSAQSVRLTGLPKPPSTTILPPGTIKP